jgi:hypothetical protein
MSVEELLKPRYKVIADYPNNSWSVGEIIDRDWGWDGDDEIGFKHHISHYPHLFQRLEWWQDRKPEEMPRYLKDTRDGEVVSAIQYGDSQVLVMARVFQCRIELRYLIPCDEADYNAYLTTNQNSK